MKQARKVFSVLLCGALVAALSPFSALAEETEAVPPTGDVLVGDVENNGATDDADVVGGIEEGQGIETDTEFDDSEVVEFQTYADAGSYGGIVALASIPAGSTLLSLFPDDVFREEVKTDVLGDGTLPDSFVVTQNEIDLIEQCDELLLSNVFSSNKIQDLSGIEYFTSLEKLSCIDNSLTSIDLSDNTALKELVLSKNALSALDLSSNTGLISLHADNNDLTSLDLSNNTALKSAFVYDNQSLTSLDVSGCVNLSELSCGATALTQLDLSTNAILLALYAHNAALTSLDVSNNKFLDLLHCGGNQLTSLDVSANTMLTSLGCGGNKLVELDVSKNTMLTGLSFELNQISSIDLSNNPDLDSLACYDNKLSTLDLTANPKINILWCANNKLLTIKGLSTLSSIDPSDPLAFDASGQQVEIKVRPMQGTIRPYESVDIHPLETGFDMNIAQTHIAEHSSANSRFYSSSVPANADFTSSHNNGLTVSGTINFVLTSGPAGTSDPSKIPATGDPLGVLLAVVALSATAGTVLVVRKVKANKVAN